MEVKKIWELPVTSTDIVDGGVKLVLHKHAAEMQLEYYDGDNNVLKSSLIFEAVEAQKYTSEMFTEYVPGTFEYLVEIIGSKWVEQLRKLNREVADYWNFKHYAIFIKSFGYYEFVAKNYKIVER